MICQLLITWIIVNCRAVAIAIIFWSATARSLIEHLLLLLYELNRSGSLPKSWQRPMERVELAFSIVSVGLLALGGIGLGIPVVSAADLVGSANNTLTISAAAADVRAALSNRQDHDSELSS